MKVEVSGVISNSHVEYRPERFPTKCPCLTLEVITKLVHFLDFKFYFGKVILGTMGCKIYKPIKTLKLTSLPTNCKFFHLFKPNFLRGAEVMVAPCKQACYVRHLSTWRGQKCHLPCQTKTVDVKKWWGMHTWAKGTLYELSFVMLLD